jgi:hypothetical protein
MKRFMIPLLLATLPLAACGPYNPSAHHYEDASTGSHLSGGDTGMDSSQGLADASVRNVTGAAPGAGR